MFLFLAVRLDNVSVKSYSVWALLDCLDWTAGYSKRYGLYNVDYGDTDRTRTPKRSAAIYRYNVDISRLI